MYKKLADLSSEWFLAFSRYFRSRIGRFVQRQQDEDALRLSHLVRKTTFHYMDQGISIFDADLRLLATNRRFRELLDFPEWLCQPNTSFEEFIRYNAARGDYGPGDADEQVRARVELARRFEPHHFERERPDGTVIEIRGLPVPGGGFVTTYTDITQRVRAERATRRLARMYAVLSATNEAILRAKSPAELYQRVCDASVHSGKFIITAVLVPEPHTTTAKIAAVTGIGEARLREVCISLDDATPEGRGLVGTAFRTRKACISNDYRNDARTLPWSGKAQEAGIAAGAAFPLMRGGAGAGVMVFYCGERNIFDDDVVKLIERMAENISFALDNFERDAQRRRTEQALRDSEARFRSLTDLSSDWFWEQDAEFRFTRFEGRHATGDSAQFESEIGRTREEIGVEVEGGWPAHRALLAAHQPFRDVIMWRTFQDGRLHYMSVSGEPIVDEANRFIGYRGVGKDITERKRAEQATRRLGRMFAALSATNDAILHAQSPEELYRRVCDAAVDSGRFSNFSIFLHEPDSMRLKVAAIAGQALEALQATHVSIDDSIPEGRGVIGTAFRTRRPCVSNDYLHDERTRPWHEIGHRAGCRSAAALPLVRGGHSIGAILIYHHELNAFDDETVSLLQRMAENVAYALDNFEREAERRQAQERIQYLATHDGLTNLPNRASFGQTLTLAIQLARRYNNHFAVLFLDLDRFKVINDTLGHDAGDTLLQEVARRLRENVRESDVVARFGGDEFVVLMQGANETEQVIAVARKLLYAIIKPVVILGQECRVTASIGISMYPTDAQDEQALMKHADVAMYFAKEEGKNNFQFYSKDIKAQSRERLALEVSLRHALERDEFFLHYQAKLDLAAGAITGVEALLRWRHPALGVILPGQFIPLAEETGLIVPIGKWVLATACSQNVAWQRAGLPPVCVAINLSPRQFADENLLKDLAAVLQETGMAPDLLELEITESMVMGNVDRAARQLTAIKEMGVRLAIDDFGTGYSSLAQIKRFPIDTIKVDRSFIREIPQNPEDNAITQAIIAMGRSLSLTVVAEGVGTPEQEQFLREHACNEIQGYYFSKPVSAEHFAELLRTHVPPAARRKA